MPINALFKKINLMATPLWKILLYFVHIIPFPPPRDILNEVIVEYSLRSIIDSSGYVYAKIR